MARHEHRLAAIMFTDIVGYDSLLKEDEKKAFDILRKNQRIHSRLIKKFKGRWLKEIGGSTLASFNSSIDAVMCALSIQKATKELNIPSRVGIHQGEVIFEKKDVLGDGVNIASRIQSVATAGDIVISEKVYSDIANKEDLDIEFLGEQSLKGVKNPLGIFKIACQDESILDFTIDTGELVRPLSYSRISIIGGIIVIAILAFALYYFLPKASLPSDPEKSILVLPFENFLGTDTLDYLVAGLHDELNGTMGKISALRVLSSRTANTFKNTEKSLTEIAKELGINIFVEGSVLCIDDSICLQVRMVDIEDKERQLWVHDFKVERSEIQNLHRLITRDFSDQIDVILTPKEKELLAETRLVDPAAHDLYMKGMVYNDQMSMDGLQRAAQYFKLANEKDPDWAPPYRGMASVLERQYQMGFVERSIALPKISEYIEKAIELDPNDSWVYNLRGSKAGWFEWDWESGEQDFIKSIELNPNHSGNHAFYAALLTRLRRTDEALPHAKLAQELDPLNPFILGICAGVYINAGECQTAIDLVEKAILIEPNHYFTYPMMINASTCIQDYQKAFEVLKELNYTEWEKYEQTENFERIFNEHGWLAVQEEVINFYEEKGLINNLREERKQASRYIEVGEYDKAMDYLSNALETHSPNLPSISTNTIYNKMKDNPRYIELLKKMNLPVD